MDNYTIHKIWGNADAQALAAADNEDSQCAELVDSLDVFVDIDDIANRNESNDNMSKSPGAEAMQKKRALKAVEDKADAEEIVSRLDGIIIQISANASEAGKLFGSVGVVEIAQALQDQVGLEIDRKDISGETVKEIGTHQFTLNLHPEVEMQITVDVQGDV